MTDRDTGVSISEAASISGLSIKQLRYFENRNYIKPDYINVGGIRQRRFSTNLVDQLTAIAEYRLKGFELETAVKLAKTTKP